MANNKSAIKRVRQREIRRIRNRDIIGAMRSAIKTARTAIDEGENTAAEAIRGAIASIDRAVNKGVVKRRTGSRYISRLSSRRAAE